MENKNNTIIRWINWNWEYYNFWEDLTFIFTLPNLELIDWLRDIFPWLEAWTFDDQFYIKVDNFTQIELLYQYYNFSYKVFNNGSYKETIFITILWEVWDNLTQIDYDYSELLYGINNSNQDSKENEENCNYVRKYLEDYTIWHYYYKNSETNLMNGININNISNTNALFINNINDVTALNITRKINEDKNSINTPQDGLDYCREVEKWGWIMYENMFLSNLSWRQILALMLAVNAIKITLPPHFQLWEINILILNQIESSDIRCLLDEVTNEETKQLIKQYFNKY